MTEARRTPLDSARPLRLRARDAADIVVFSTQLQDAIVPLRDIGYDRSKRVFAMVLNRFRWDLGEISVDDTLGSDEADEEETAEAEAGPVFARGHAGLRFHHVRAVRQRGLDRGDPGNILYLLSVKPRQGAVVLAFAGGGEIEVVYDRLEAFLEDLGDPWITRTAPTHNDDGAFEPGGGNP